MPARTLGGPHSAAGNPTKKEEVNSRCLPEPNRPGLGDRQKPRPRHQFDDAFRCPELRAVCRTDPITGQPIARSGHALMCRERWQNAGPRRSGLRCRQNDDNAAEVALTSASWRRPKLAEGCPTSLSSIAREFQDVDPTVEV